MAHFSDPISEEGTPHKRRRLDHSDAPSKAWDSQDDDGDDLFEEDFQTVPTQALNAHKRKAPGYSAHNFHSEMDSMKSSQVQPHTTQPTQPLPTNSSAVLVDRSSPPTSPPNPLPRVVPFAKPRTSLLASSLAPQGTAFRLPAGVQRKQPVITLDDSDDEPDPPVQPDSDEETQGLKSNIKPTNFKRGGRGLNSTPNRSESSVVRESPQAPAGRTAFSDIMRGFEYNPSQVTPRTVPTSYEKLEDVPDFNVRRNIERMRNILPTKSVQTCYDALIQKKNNMADALELINTQDDEVDELSTMSPVAKRGVANPVFQRTSGFTHPVKPKQMAKQVVAGSRSIAEKYGSLHAQSQRQPAPATQSSQLSDDDVRPKGRLIQRRKQRSPSPTSPPQKLPIQRLKQHKKVITISDDEEEESDSGGKDEDDESDEEVQVVPSDFDDKLLKHLNETTVRDLSELCALSEDAVKFVLDQRPFSSLDEVRAISKTTETKSGKKSRSRPIGDKIVEVSSEMLTGYDAVDELVKECAELAEPIKQALRTWGLRDGESELQLMNLDEAHDSGIGTPASSCAPDADDLPHSKSGKNSVKNKFLGQPENMGEVVMKDYQLVGLNWLNLLWSKKISCILADDMGLGKTCQVIAFLAHLQMKKVDGVHLVIVPGSTLENWLREFARFAPSLRVVPYYGSQAERPELQVQIEEEFSDIDVIVTTYDMTRGKDDNKFLRHLGPAVCVYDEAHALRNPKSDRYTQLMKIPADFKVLLTGTPLQNNLQELIAILAFIMPDLFQGKREELDYIFKHKATTKDTAHAALLSSERIARARTMMTPFILRRKKQQVLDLPTKHSRVERCDMTESQEEYYNGLLAAAQQFFADKAMNKTKGKGGGSKESTNILMALRKAAIHPLLSRRLFTEKKLDKIQAACSKDGELAGNPPQRIRDYLDGTAAQSLKGGDYGLHVYCADPGRPHLHKFALKNQEWMDSGKVRVFKKLVKQYQENGDRLLVFSQFTTLMDVLEAVLETMGVKFFRLDGSTAMNTRQDMLDEFHNDTSITVFMLSTKAGGAGINLACANKVIIFDSGFNPQDDIQAENRAHRVGQTREVEVVRLVSKGTIEEQIHALGESKIALDEQVSSEATTAAEDKAAEKSGQEMVEKMFMETFNQTKDNPPAQGQSGDLKDAFKLGMEEAGVKISSKQAQF